MDDSQLAALADWTRTDMQMPPDGEVVATMDSGGRVQTLRYRKPLWWFPDGSMYVYYTPLFWRALAKGSEG